MTVCAAAICEGTMIVGVADRMLTARDIQFEPVRPKILPLTSAVAAMIAGDSSLQTEILIDVHADIVRRVQAEPTNWWAVRDIADLYVRYHNRACLKRAEAAILAPLGLDNNTFIARQKDMAPQLVTQLATELINFSPPDAETIFAGLDATGPHIYIARGGQVSCQDSVGFAAIGAGYWHTDSQFMFAGHTATRQLPETLLLAYTAKKRAEVAPGVGKDTDMVVIGPALGNFSPVGEHVLKKLDEIYMAAKGRAEKAKNKDVIRITEYVTEILNAAVTTEQAAVPQDGGGDSAADEKAPERNGPVN